ncbi:hypothetical protein HanPSC8_Chr10g0416691 [Helianthus annuus]|nr:hypothetical protein HanPSC8_Chr10g0416691 [Helianthus annuus]
MQPSKTLIAPSFPFLAFFFFSPFLLLSILQPITLSSLDSKIHNRTYCIPVVHGRQIFQSPLSHKTPTLFNKHKSYGCV